MSGGGLMLMIYPRAYHIDIERERETHARCGKSICISLHMLPRADRCCAVV